MLDSDDVWIDQNKLKLQVAAMEKDPSLVVVGTQVRLIDKGSRNLGDYLYATRDYEIRKNTST